MLEIRHFRAFVAVAEELGFHKAAARLRISQPALSSTIKQLEDLLGMALFHRSRQHVRLTQAGTAFLRQARIVLDQVDLATNVARDAERFGILRIGYAHSADLSVLPHVLRYLKDKHSCLERTVLQQMCSVHQLSALRDRAIDVGILRPPDDLRMAHEAELEIQVLMDEPIYAAVHEQSKFAQQNTVSLKRLKDVPIIIFPRVFAENTYDALISQASEVGVTLRIAHEIDQLQTALGLAAEGLGVAFVPRSALLSRRHGVTFRPLAKPAVTSRLALAWRRGDDSREVRAARDAAEAAVRQHSDQIKKLQR